MICYINLQICEQAVNEYKTQSTPSRKDALGQLLASKDENGRSLSHEELVASTLILVFAGDFIYQLRSNFPGVETTAIMLTYATYVLGKDPDLQSQLSQELSAYPDVDSIDLMSLEKLPLLNAFIKEVMRLWPPAPSPFGRVVPKKGIFIQDYYLPGGVRIQTCDNL